MRKLWWASAPVAAGLMLAASSQPYFSLVRPWTWSQEQVIRCTLAEVAEQMHAAGITRTAVIVVGDVLAAQGFTDSYLYSAGRTRGERH